MIKTLHGRIRGRTIELDEDLGVEDGQEVEVQVEMIPPSQPQAAMSKGLAKVYEILGRRHSSGGSDPITCHTAISANAVCD